MFGCVHVSMKEKRERLNHSNYYVFQGQDNCLSFYFVLSARGTTDVCFVSLQIREIYVTIYYLCWSFLPLLRPPTEISLSKG